MVALCGGCFNPTAKDSDPGTTTDKTTTSSDSTSDAPTTACASECQPTTTATTTTTTTPPGETSSGPTTTSDETTDETTGATTGDAPAFVLEATVAISSPFALVAGRFDELDNLDLMVTSAKMGLTRISGGTWAAELVLPDHPPARAIAITDFPPGDGLDDLILAQLDSVATILTVSDAPPVPLWVEPAPCNSQSMVFADLIGDASPDIVLACPGTTKVHAFEGGGQPTFSAYVDIEVLVTPDAIAVANMVDTGVPDLLIASAAGSKTSVFPGLDKTNFAAALDFPMETPNVLAADVGPGLNPPEFNNAVVSQGTGCIHLTGGPGIETDSPFDCGDSVVYIALGDINNDDIADLVTLGSTLSNPGLNVYTNDGAGNFTHIGTYEVGKEPHRLILADLDSDSRVDIAVTTGGTVDIFRNNL